MNTRAAIGKVNKRIEEVLRDGSTSLSELYASSGLKDGKRLRAKMFFCFSGDESEVAVDIASSIELLHAATLIHDDVLDNSCFRRGRAALYRDRGIPESILYGDYVFSEAFKLASALKNPGMIQEMITALSETLKGEIWEQENRGNISLSREAYLRVIEMKSGCLFGVSAKLGALMRKDGVPMAERAYRFGLNLGMVYQMIDDYMDYFGASEGKVKYNDIGGSIVTLPLITLIERCSPEEMRIIVSVLTKKVNVSQKVTELMETYDIALSVLDEIDIQLEKMKKLFFGMSEDAICRGSEMLLWLKEQADNARKEYCNSRRRGRRHKRPQAIKEV
jgi:octaprenyl-diphosphate synthase